MDVAEAMLLRRSIRAFKPDPVPQEVLRGIFEVARFAPSCENIQPWGIAVVTGEVLQKLRGALAEVAERDETRVDLPYNSPFPEPYNTRRRTLGLTVMGAKGIGREDKEKRRWWRVFGIQGFDAPVLVLVYTDRAFNNTWSISDCSFLGMQIMLLATKHGLGTCPQMASTYYPDVTRSILGLPDSKLLVLGLSLGYPNWDDPVNNFPRGREAVENLVKWYGFDGR